MGCHNARKLGIYIPCLFRLVWDQRKFFGGYFPIRKPCFPYTRLYSAVLQWRIFRVLRECITLLQKKRQRLWRIFPRKILHFGIRLLSLLIFKQNKAEGI